MRRIYCALFWFSIFTTLALAEEAGECKCETPKFQEHFRSSTTIFEGKVVSLETKGDDLKVEFAVEHVWKGEKKDRVSVFTSNAEATCGYAFEKEKSYLVYAGGTPFLWTSRCSRTQPTDVAGADLKQLREKTGIPMRSLPQPKKKSGRDPFSSMTGDSVGQQRGSNAIPRTLNITNAVIKAISKRGDQYWVIIKAADGRTYTMKEGDRLHDGKILKIDLRSVTFGRYTGYRMQPVKKYLRPFPD